MPLLLFFNPYLLINLYALYCIILSFCAFNLKDFMLSCLLQMAVTDELLQKQAVIIKQICELFPMQRVRSLSWIHFLYPTVGMCMEESAVIL